MDSYTRTALFWGLCIPTRIAVAAFLPDAYLPMYCFALMFGFAVLFITNSRLNAPEGGGTTWWAKYRGLHALIFLIAGLLALLRYDTTDSRAVLLLDTVLAALLWITQRK